MTLTTDALEVTLDGPGDPAVPDAGIDTAPVRRRDQGAAADREAEWRIHAACFVTISDSASVRRST